MEPVIAVLAQTLAIALALASPGARPAVEPLPDNVVRARRGLLPRKAAKPRPASRLRRAVLLPPAPTWLGEPGQVTEPAPEAVVAAEPVAADDVLAARPEPAELPAVAPLPPGPPGDPPAAEGSAVPVAAAPVEPEVVPDVGEPLVVALASLPAGGGADVAPAAPEEAPAPLSALLEGVEVAWLMVRRVEEAGDGALLRATVAGPELEVVVRRPVEPE